MSFFRNPEIRKTLLIYIIISTAAIIAAFVWDKLFGLFVLVLCVVLTALYCLTTYMRYRRICEFSADIDRILHGYDESQNLKSYEEGELGILQSEVRKMTVRLREQRQQLTNDKLYLADSIADISHQIRTPLTAINLLVHRLSEPGLTEDKRIRLFHELMGLLSRIDWLITALLKISKIDAGTAQFKQDKILLSELIQKSSEPLLVPIEVREQHLVIDAKGEFTGDISWTQEAIGNILKNCMEHTPKGGSIEIAADENALYSEIVISDNGSGIDKEDMPHIFERFYKGKNSDEKSFGIGLALARMIITAQNGTVKAENIPTGGARFAVRFYKGTV